jgi:hypothetical protein
MQQFLKLCHDQYHCEEYGGIAVRIIGKQPLSYQTMQQIQELTGANKAFLGSNTGVIQPMRRMFLLFKGDGSLEHNENVVKQLPVVMKQLIRDDRLYGLPQIVDIKTRNHGCIECGELKRDHVCPFFNTYSHSIKNKSAHAQQPMLQQPLAAANSKPVDPAADSMCRAWRRSKQCTHRNSCRYQHPADHVVTKQPCFSFQNTGMCSRGDQCNYAHGIAAVAVSSAVSVTSPAVNQARLNSQSNPIMPASNEWAHSLVRKRMLQPNY